MNGKFRNRYRVASARAPWWDYGSDGSYFITLCTPDREHFFGEIHKGKMHRSAIGNIVQTIWKDIPVRFSYIKLGTFILMPNHVHGILSIDKSNGNEPGNIVHTVVLPDIELLNKDGRKNRMPNDEFIHKDDCLIDGWSKHEIPIDNFMHMDGPLFDDFSNVETRLIASLHSKNERNTTVHGEQVASISNEQDAVIPDNPDSNQPIQPNSSIDGLTGKSQLILRGGGVTGIYNPMLHQNLSRVMRWFTGRITFEAHKVNPRFKWQRRFYDHIIRDHAEYKSISRYILRNPGNWERDQFY